ncbi:hypothetical protein WHR41_09391 [Cladosporium halotolerans]|uniref:Uncharacterized protein n=1 Tax=Cladosporium halotolerans TaxID=1052096 RepID=A0AB34KGM7_9PEZI
MSSITLKPTAAKRAGNLWRMDTTGEYISGEEMLSGWAPRGISLIRDFIDLRRRQRRTAKIEAARGVLSLGALSPPSRPTSTEQTQPTETQQALAQKFLSLWLTPIPKSDSLLLRSNTSSPEPTTHQRPTSSSSHSASDHSPPPALAALVTHNRKAPTVLESGWLLAPDAAGARWIKRFAELRRPYLHLYASDGDEVAAINLTNSRIDAEPKVARLLQREKLRMEVWAVYAVKKAWLFASRSDRERGGSGFGRWIGAMFLVGFEESYWEGRLID